jgi:hypothetical protein
VDPDQSSRQIALRKTKLDHVNVFLRPRLLSDNGSCDLSHDLENYLQRKHIGILAAHPTNR